MQRAYTMRGKDARVTLENNTFQQVTTDSNSLGGGVATYTKTPNMNFAFFENKSSFLLSLETISCTILAFLTPDSKYSHGHYLKMVI